eukprot:TRINITY_DN33143_c0_g1_i1.p1 TRINITY_DN33143_c0_g1~~TRINITY_DN33143_c0_g1_i1.p1  ORF type:complete len:402 (+),score=69.41 TRINITY_DN33143_c0_g1_i1:191-1396(+)
MPAGSPTNDAAVPRCKCVCGTVLFFPGGVRSRTCWNCSMELQLPPPAPPQETCFVDKRGGNRKVGAPTEGGTGGVARRPDFLPEVADRRPQFLPEALDVRDGVKRKESLDATGNSPSTKDSHAMPTEWPEDAQSRKDDNGCGRSCLSHILLFSLVVNALLVWKTYRGSGERPDGAPVLVVGGDADGDGIPDHEDFCPVGKCGWTSGKATDFDGDGCEDAAEDLDIDNDGISDKEDKCPKTPMHYTFVSSDLSDFDGDGCADGVEDLDNDGDDISNSEDLCPRTTLGDESDGDGCSKRQILAKVQKEDPRWWEHLKTSCRAPAHSAKLPEKASDDSGSDGWFEYSVDQIRGASVEIVVGAVLTAVLMRVNKAATNMHQTLPETASNDLGRHISGQIFSNEGD